MPAIILANDKRGQCHKYNGKLIKPSQTIILFDKILRLKNTSDPAEMINAVPIVGANAQKPGKCRFFVIIKALLMIITAPSIERKLGDMSQFSEFGKGVLKAVVKILVL